MALIRLDYSRRLPKQKTHKLGDICLPHNQFNSFNSDMLGLGDLNPTSDEVVSTLAVMFDLEGFTSFSSRPDMELFLPNYVKEFVTWLFDRIRNESTETKGAKTVYLYCPLPFFSKFTGDGALFLWNIDHNAIDEYCRKHGKDKNKEIQGDILNIVSILYDVCGLYQEEFVPKFTDQYNDIPRRLRCGIARGRVCPVARGLDYVGPCINKAARLQKLYDLTLGISAAGIDITAQPGTKLVTELIRKRVLLRGIGKEDVLILRREFENLSKADRKNFSSSMRQIVPKRKNSKVKTKKKGSSKRLLKRKTVRHRKARPIKRRK